MIVFILFVAIAAGVAVYALTRKKPEPIQRFDYFSVPSFRADFGSESLLGKPTDSADAQVSYGEIEYDGLGNASLPVISVKPPRKRAAKTSAKPSAKAKPVAKKKVATKTVAPKKKAAKTPAKRGVILKKKATAKTKARR